MPTQAPSGGRLASYSHDRLQLLFPASSAPIPVPVPHRDIDCAHASVKIPYFPAELSPILESSSFKLLKDCLLC